MNCSYQWNTDRRVIRQWSDHDPTLTWTSAPRVFSDFFFRAWETLFVSQNATRRASVISKILPHVTVVPRKVLPQLMTFMQNLPRHETITTGKPSKVTSQPYRTFRLPQKWHSCFILVTHETSSVMRGALVFITFLLLFFLVFLSSLLCSALLFQESIFFFLFFVSLFFFGFRHFIFFFSWLCPECSYMGNLTSIANKGLLINSHYRFLSYPLKVQLGTGPMLRVIDYVKWWLPHWRAQGYGHEITHAASKLLYGWWWSQIFRARQKISGFSGCIMCCVEENYIFLGPWRRLIFSVF